jgi:hypothetical protein
MVAEIGRSPSGLRVNSSFASAQDKAAPPTKNKEKMARQARRYKLKKALSENWAIK